MLMPNVVFSANLNGVAISSPGTTNSDWSAVALLVSGKDFDKDGYINGLKEYVHEKYQTDFKLSKNKSTEWHRIALAANLAGEDVTDFDGINLINDGVFYRKNLAKQGLNAYIWALITLSSGNFEEPDGAINTKNSIINSILERQNEDGGFSLAGNISSCDITSMAIYALSFYQAQENVKSAVIKALNYLLAIQNKDGSFSEDGIPNAESTAQAIIAFDSLGFDANINDFLFKAKSALEYFKTEDGFSHLWGGETDTMATYQSICAMASLNKATPLYSNFVKKANDNTLKNSKPVVINTEEPSEKQTVESEKESECDYTEPIDETNLEIGEEYKTNIHFHLIFVFTLVVFCGIIALRRKK